MEDSSHWSIPDLGHNEDVQEEEGLYQDSSSTASEHTDDYENLNQNTEEESFVCQPCEIDFASREDFERHMHVHAFPNSEAHETETKPLQEESPQTLVRESSQHQMQPGESTALAAVLEEGTEHAGQYMLDVSSNISENLSFYIDGKILSTSTVSNCELAEVHSGSSALVGLDALIVDPVQISEVLKTDKEIPGQQHVKRRTATPPLLPQIKTELESEVVVSSSSSSLVSSIMENLFPQSSESIVVQKERTVFLSPKLKQLLEKQEGLKPTLALIADGQKPSSPISLTALPSTAGRFKRRTGSPTRSQQQNPTSNEETQASETGESSPAGTGQMEMQLSSPVEQTAKNKYDGAKSLPVAEQVVKPVLSKIWLPVTGGNSCNQRPLDLSNTVKRNEDSAAADAALDLSLQRRNQDESELALDLVSQANESNASMAEKALMKIREQKMNLESLETPIVTDFTIVTGSDIVTPLDPVAEGLVYGLTLPQSSLTPPPTSLTPMTLEPASPCTIAFASPVTQAMLPTAPSLITVLAPPSLANTSSQSIQVVAPNIPPEPMVICAENPLASQCDIRSAFATTNSGNIIALSQPLDPTLNLPGHVFLTDQIALSSPLVKSTPGPEVPFTPTVNLNDSLFNSYNIASNTVLIECTIALEAPGSVVPVTLQENTTEPPAPTQMVVNHIEEQQQIVSLPDSQTVVLSSITESATLLNNTEIASDSPAMTESPSDSDPVVATEPPTTNNNSDTCLSGSEIVPTSPSPEKSEEESSNETNVEQQLFTKNFICNVCDKLFHSMKELGHHIGDHADEWPYKCEFCVLLFGKPSALLDHRSSLHGVGKTYVCSACTKEFVYLCNLKQHQEELHPGQQCTYTEEEKGKLRPQNYNSLTKVNTDHTASESPDETKKSVKKEECEVDATAEKLFTTIKVMATDGGKMKGPDVRLGINQHYPSFKPPPFPYHNRSPAGSLASATNFTTHNIPQTFSTAIRCTKCGKSFDNMPELHKHILDCANASDKKRYTPKKNPIPLRHFAKTQNGVLSTTNSANGLNASVRVTQPNRPKLTQESPVKFKVLKKKKKKLVQRVMPQRNKSVSLSNKVSQVHVNDQHEVFVCPHCNREFTMRRSRTKHMAVCPKKMIDVKKRKEGGISVTKENVGHLHRGVSHVREKQESPPQHKTRLQTSGSMKRPAILPVQTVLSSKRSKMIIKGSAQPTQETLTELPIRTFNPSMRQYGKVPIKITVVRPQPTTAQRAESLSPQSRQEATNIVSEQSA